MEIKEINKLLTEKIKRLENYYKDKSKNDLTKAMSFKVIEEMGELFEKILHYEGYQRKSKLTKVSNTELKNGLEEEFADVIFTILILANRMNIDIENAIKNKMEVVKKRKYEE